MPILDFVKAQMFQQVPKKDHTDTTGQYLFHSNPQNTTVLPNFQEVLTNIVKQSGLPQCFNN